MVRIQRLMMVFQRFPGGIKRFTGVKLAYRLKRTILTGAKLVSMLKKTYFTGDRLVFGLKRTNFTETVWHTG
jgi:hypothetical protein